MLIKTIAFEIPNSETGIPESFLIEDTIENQEKVFSHRYTRLIQFTKTFDFQFANEGRMPLEFIDMAIWVMLINNDPELFAAVAELTEV